MNIGAQFQTKEGNIFIADVVNKKIMKIGADGNKTDWTEYAELRQGDIGESLVIIWPDTSRKTIRTSEIVKLEFPKIGD